METKVFDNELGIQLNSVQDVLNALNLGMNIVTENGDYLNADREDENGEERLATTEEIIEDACVAFKVGGGIYATMQLPSDCNVVKCSGEVMTSKYKVGQTCYILHEGKIISTRIRGVVISKWASKEVEYNVERNLGMVAEGKLFTTKDELVKHLLEEK